MVWVYDKRSANGCAFVYFGCVPIDSNTPEAKLLIAYTRRVLDALDVKNGTQNRAFRTLPLSTTLTKYCISSLASRRRISRGSDDDERRTLLGGKKIPVLCLFLLMREMAF